VGAKFARRAQQFPGLINGCTIDWFLPWPEEALTSGGCCAALLLLLRLGLVCVGQVLLLSV